MPRTRNLGNLTDFLTAGSTYVSTTTPPAGDNSTNLATTAFVVSATAGMRAVYTANGSFTVPVGVTTIWVSACAGGGGGGGSPNQASGNISSGGSGGGAGQWVLRQAYTVTPGQVISITIGNAGAAGAVGASGGAGGNTILSGVVTLTGGSPGTNGVATTASTQAGPLGGAGYPAGGFASDATAGASSAMGGTGASCPFGGGGAGARGATSGSVPAIPGFGYGSGGGGAGGQYTTGATAPGQPGGAGMPGFVLLEW